MALLSATSFCEAVMLEKEVAGRQRQHNLSSQPPREDAPGVGSRETTPGHRRRGPVDGEQWVAHRPYDYVVTTDRRDGAFVFPRAPQRDVSNWRGQSGPMPAGAVGCSKEIPRSRNAKGTRRNMGGF